MGTLHNLPQNLQTTSQKLQKSSNDDLKTQVVFRGVVFLLMSNSAALYWWD